MRYAVQVLDDRVLDWIDLWHKRNGKRITFASRILAQKQLERYTFYGLDPSKYRVVRLAGNEKPRLRRRASKMQAFKFIAQSSNLAEIDLHELETRLCMQMHERYSSGLKLLTKLGYP